MELTRSGDRDEEVIALALTLQQELGLIPRFAILKALQDLGLPASDQDELRIHAAFMIQDKKQREQRKAEKRIRPPRTKTWRDSNLVRIQTRFPLTFAEASQPKEKD